MHAATPELINGQVLLLVRQSPGLAAARHEVIVDQHRFVVIDREQGNLGCD